ncbi:MAG: hypothetical protein ABR566_17960, partial [Pyrinomonadaceae bacterium]
FAARAAAIAAFVRNGGGLLGFTNDVTNPYAYLSGFGTFTTNVGLQYSNITPTAAGAALGITDALDQDVEFFHDQYLTFPAGFQVLATNAGQTAGNTTPITRPVGTIGTAAAIGGLNIGATSGVVAGGSAVRVTELARTGFCLQNVFTNPLDREVVPEVLNLGVAANGTTFPNPCGGFATVNVVPANPIDNAADETRV